MHIVTRLLATITLQTTKIIQIRLTELISISHEHKKKLVEMVGDQNK